MVFCQTRDSVMDVSQLEAQSQYSLPGLGTSRQAGRVLFEGGSQWRPHFGGLERVRDACEVQSARWRTARDGK